MPIIMRNTPAGRRAFPISKVEAEKLVASGDAVQDKCYSDIYEEITEGERSQGYLTRNMAPLPPVAARRKPGRPPKNHPAEDPAPSTEE